jgi:integrase
MRDEAGRGSSHRSHATARGTGRAASAVPGWAGLTGADIFADDATRRPINFHHLRHTGITWRAVRGDKPSKIMRAAGHDDLSTTQRYINEAQTFEGDLLASPSRRCPSPPSPVSARVWHFGCGKPAVSCFS